MSEWCRSSVRAKRKEFVILFLRNAVLLEQFGKVECDFHREALRHLTSMERLNCSISSLCGHVVTLILVC